MFRYLVAALMTASALAAHFRSPMEEAIRNFRQHNSAGGQNYAVLVAGSNTYSNYRHQADICHAYQLLSRNGIPESNIIVMMYDDIAMSPSNPKKGTIINHIGGSDVYANVPKDYIGNDVTAKNFLAILAGQAMDGIGSGKTLKSGPNDNVFIFYSDHGASGLVAMPVGPYLYETDLTKTLKDMYTNKRYNQLVFYLEACESGSMFLNLPKNINIYATSASTPYESSYACYFDSSVNTYVGDCYSVAWMENADEVDLKTETLETQFEITKKVTTMSQVCQYGDLAIDTEDCDEFLAGSKTSKPMRKALPAAEKSPLDSRDVSLKYYSNMVAKATTQVDFDYWAGMLSQEVRSRDYADSVFESINNALLNLAPSAGLAEPDCLKTVVEGTENACGKFTDYSLKHVRVLNGACAAGISADNILNIVRNVC